MRGSLLRWTGVLALAALSEPARADPGSWSLYDRYTTSYAIPFIEPLDFDTNPTGAFVHVSVNGGTIDTFQLDTGSQGMVVPANLVPDFQPTGRPGQITYTSSNITAKGYWTTVTVHFPDSTDGHGGEGVASAEVEVLVATEACQGSDCNNDLSGIPRMIGIGFGRPAESGGGMQPSLLNNPLLNIAGMDDGTMRAGYLFTGDHVDVGLTSANAGSGFAYYKLLKQDLPDQAGTNWATLPATIVVTYDGSTNTYEGLPLLIDTGISYNWTDIHTPSSHAACPTDDPTLPDEAECAEDGAEVMIYVGGSTQVGFGYTTGETGNPIAPWFTRTDHNNIGSNAGIHPIGGFDYLFDSVAGIEGLRATGLASDHIAFQPFISMAGRLTLKEAFATDLPVYLRQSATIHAADRARFDAAFAGPGDLTIGGKGSVAFNGNVTLPGGIVVNGHALFNAATAASLTVGAEGKAVNAGAFTGDVVNHGSFSNDGSVAGDVANHGTFSGNGVVHGNLTSTGVTAPGHSLGTVTVSGDATFVHGSTYVAEIGAPGESDRIVVGGAAVIDHATLLVTPLAGGTPGFGAYRVLSAGSVSGAFVVSAPEFGVLGGAYPFLSVTAETDATGVDVVVGRSAVAFAAAAETPNQEAVGAALDRLAVDSPLALSMATLDAASARTAFDSLSGAIYPSAAGLLAEGAFATRDGILARLNQTMAAPGADDAAAPATRDVELASAATMWVTTGGDWGHTGASGNTAAFDRSTGGVLAGVDAVAASGWRFGFAAGYDHADFSMSDLASSGSADSGTFAAYAGRRFADVANGELVVSLGAAYGWHALSTDRTIAYPGMSDRVSADWTAADAVLFGEVAHAIGIGPPAKQTSRIETFAGLAYAAVDGGRFREAGGMAALKGSAGDFDTAVSQVGVRGEVRLPLAPDVTLGGSVGWQHIFSPSPTANLAFASGGPAFSVAGASLAEDALLLRAGLSAAIGPSGRLGLFYAGEIASTAATGAVTGSLSIRF